MTAFAERFLSAPDGLQLYARDYDQAGRHLAPVVCLAGLTRNSRDFETIAPHLARTRRVITIDCRGRGRSAYDPNFMNYAVAVETADVLSVMAGLGAPEAVILGTSRGGLIANLIAVMRPAALKGVILNDVGPELDPRGIARIISYAGKQKPHVADWAEAVATLRSVNEAQFTLSDADWLAAARRIYREENGRLTLDYDQAIGRALAEQAKSPQLFDPWTLFGALAHVPLLVLRGAQSDLLSADTVEKMGARHKRCSSVEIPGRGHAPFLDEPESIAAIDAFLAGMD